MGLATATTTRTIDLGRDQLVTFEAPHGRIEMTHGCAWLTEAGGAHDTFLTAGEGWRLTGRPVTLGALAPTRVRLVGAVAPDGFGLARRWQRLVRSVRGHVQRLQLGPSGMHPWQ